MSGIDWLIVVIYMFGMVGMSLYLGRGQKDEKDYYLGGNDLSYWSIGISTMATQCSTNSLLGAPAFVITTGLLWLQYEIAVPIAMIAVMVFLLPFFRKQNVVSIYEYLELRFGPSTRTLLSVLFQFLRAFATGVTVYGISVVIQAITGVPFWAAVLCLGIVTIIYDFFGGMKAVVYSDVIQMILLYGGIVLCLIYAINELGGLSNILNWFPAERANAVDFNKTGFSKGSDFGFLPMLLGGLFLYVSYYGCDQTQVQRELSSKNVDDTNMSLFINGILRFPLVLTYCLLGVVLSAFICKNPGFIDSFITMPSTKEKRLLTKKELEDPKFWTVTEKTFKEKKAFLSKLNKQETEHSKYIRRMLSRSTQQMIAQYKKESKAEENLIKKIATELNGIFKDRSIFEKEYFAKVKLKEDTKRLLQRSLFTIDKKYAATLQKGIISKELRAEFEKLNNPIAEKAKVKNMRVAWVIYDKNDKPAYLISSMQIKGKNVLGIEPKGTTLIRLNRWLLEDSFPDEVERSARPDFNLTVPKFVIDHLPVGIVGLIMVALFAAAMSSLDSTINSLSATTIRDLVERFHTKGSLEEKQQLMWSRVTTIFWGALCTIFSFFVGGISDSIIESINKVSSLAAGPILGTFLLAILTRKANEKGVIVGIITGFVGNLVLWKMTEISWLWWNVIGCLVTFFVGYGLSIFLPGDDKNIDELVYQRNASKFFNFKRNWPRYYAALVFYSIFIIACCYGIGMLK